MLLDTYLGISSIYTAALPLRRSLPPTPPELLHPALHSARHRRRDVMDRLAEALQGFDAVDAGGGGGGGAAAGGRAAAWRPSVPYVRIDGSHDSSERRTAVIKFRCACPL